MAKTLKSLPKEQREDIIGEWFLDERKIKTEDYRFLNKLFDHIDLDSYDKGQLSKSGKYI